MTTNPSCHDPPKAKDPVAVILTASIAGRRARLD